MKDYEIGGMTVSALEMRHNPRPTVETIFDWMGFEWASRLWQEWHEREIRPQEYGLEACRAHDESRQIKAWLEERRPKQAHATQEGTR